MDVVQIDGWVNCEGVNSPNQAAEFSPGEVPMHGVKQRMGRRRVRGVREHTVYITKNRHLQAVVGMVVRWVGFSIQFRKRAAPQVSVMACRGINVCKGFGHTCFVLSAVTP
jgi:hypothetical protein